MSEITLPAFGRGETFYGPNQTIPSTYGSESLGHEGLEKVFRDINFAATTLAKPLLSNNDVECIAVRNASALALTPGTLVKWKAGYYGKRVEITSVAAEACAGVVDPYLPSAGVRVGDICFIVVKGPTLVTKTTGGGTDHAQGTAVVTDNAGKAVASGTPSDATAATALALNTVGRVITAPATADTTMRISSDFRFAG